MVYAVGNRVEVVKGGDATGGYHSSEVAHVHEEPLHCEDSPMCAEKIIFLQMFLSRSRLGCSSSRSTPK